MKTKHILTALALPALLAACNNDEFESMNFEQAQSERPLLSEDFVLKMGFEGADTRYAVEGDGSLDFKFTDGDQLGAAIIDEYKPDESDIAKWPVIYSLAGNNPFTYNANADEWKSATRLGIGHYLYVYPYSPEDNNRAAVSYSLPTIQELYQTEDGAVDLNAAIEKGNKAVYSNILDEDNQTLEASLKNLYAYPKFVINFDNGQNVTSVSKVVLEYNNGEGFAVKGGFNHKNVVDLFKDPDTKWENVQTADLIIDANDTEAAKYTTIEHSQYLIAKLPKNAKVQTNSVTNNKYIEVRFMMPSAQMTYTGTDYTGDYAKDLNMYIYTNNGVYQIKDVFGNIVFKDTTPVEQKVRVFARTTSFTLNMKNLTSDNKVNDNLNIVTNVEDWNNLVSAYGSFEKFTDIDPLKVAVVGEDFTLNASAKMPSKAIFEITTEVNVEGAVTLSNVKVTNTVTVEEGATLTTSGSFTANKVENNGTMNIAVVTVNNQVQDYSKVGEIENNATLNVVEGAKATFKLMNNKGAEVENEGTLTVDNGSENYGTINNYATLNSEGLENAAREYNTAGKVINEPTIINAEGAKILAKKNELLNKSLIVNEGTLTCKNEGGTITNDKDEKGNPAVLDSKSSALTYITNNANGKVIVYSANTSSLTISSTKGIVEYTTSKSSESFKGSLVNSVIASDDYEITEGSLSKLTLTDGATLKLTANKAFLTALEVQAGRTTLGTNLSVVKLVVAEGAMVEVPAGITLEITGDNNDLTDKDLDNKGTILVGGSFVAQNIVSTTGGNVENNGGNANITWGKTEQEKDEENALAVYNAALEKMVQAWMIDDARDAWTKVEEIYVESWTSTSVTGLATSEKWSDLATAAMNAYNAYQEVCGGETVADLTSWIAVFISTKPANGIISNYKTYGNGKRGDVITKVKSNNDWISSNVYVKPASTTAFKDIAISGGNTMVVDFAADVNIISSGYDIATDADATVNGKVDADKKKALNKAILLSLKSVTANDVQATWVPAYSYIGTYEGAEEYEVMALLNKYRYGVNKLSWNNNITAANLKDASGIKTAMTALYNAYYNGQMSAADKLQLGITEEQLTTYATAVLNNWKYKTEQLTALYNAVQP